jgi:CDP-glucose 4,6-dehydratase|tara:strand:- start:2054 stop:3076 length:1023 start_codon:yes stop_codon:yes gene_type:complete
MRKKIFWKNKKVLITGIAGFVGSNLAKNLSNNGANVIGLTQNKKIESLLFYEKIDKKVNLFFGDITNKILIKKILVKFKIEICFHLAAQVEVGLAQRNPYGTWETNIRGTYTLLEAVRENSKYVKSIIIASSDKAYGEYGLKKMPYKENYKLKPIFPYDTSKACADMIAKSYTSKLFNLPIIITRFSNIYGPGQLNFTALIPDSIKSCILNKKFVIRGNGESIRDYIYINDIVDVYKLLSEKLYINPKKYSGEIFNAGTNTPHKTKEILKKIFLYKGKIKEFKKITKSMKKNKTSGELSIQYMDYKKLYDYFGWKPKGKFNSNLPKIYNWYKSYFKKQNK